MKDNTTIPSVRMFFPKDSYPPVHMLADICPCEKSTFKRLHIYYFAVFTALKSRNLFVSLSICPFPSCLFFLFYCSSCLSSTCYKDQFSPTWCCLSPRPGVIMALLSLFCHSAKTSFALAVLYPMRG